MTRLLRPAVFGVGLIIVWIAPPAQAPVEIPTTVIGLVGLVIVTQAGIIYFLLKQLFEQAAKYADIASKNAEVVATVAGSLREVVTEVKQGRDIDALKKQLEDLAVQNKPQNGRRRKGQT